MFDGDGDKDGDEDGGEDDGVRGMRLKKNIRFTVRGHPQPHQHYRTVRGYVYNPSADSQALFRRVVRSMLPCRLRPNDDEGGPRGRRSRRSRRSRRKKDDADAATAEDNDATNTTKTVLFEVDEAVAMTLVIRLLRPKNRFVWNRPGPGRIRPRSLARIYPGLRVDVDNLVSESE